MGEYKFKPGQSDPRACSSDHHSDDSRNANHNENLICPLSDAGISLGLELEVFFRVEGMDFCLHIQTVSPNFLCHH